MGERTPAIVAESEDFSPGYLDTPEPDTLPYGATPDAKNAVFFRMETQDRQRASMRRRKGSRLLNPTTISAGKTVAFAWEFERENGTTELIVACNGALYVYDGATTFTALTGGTGFSTTAEIFGAQFKNNLIVSDGTVTKRYDGTACFDMGFIAPTAAPALAATGVGLTGTYEGYAVWVDSTTGHESSPSATSTAVALVNQSRQWTKPAGAPPANVTHWRIYSRRTDTTEANFFKTGVDQTVATATYTEATSDTARNDTPGPRVSSNDVPPAFAIVEEFKGYRIGIKANSSDAYFSKQFDAESQHPADVFPVGGRGDSKAVRSVRKFGEDCYLRKPGKSYRLVGDRVPFAIDPVENSYGAVSQSSGREIDDYWYDWDEVRGPYVTDMTTWEPLADNRIRTIVDTVNRLYLHKIKSVHVSVLNLMVWAVPTTASRKRTLLAYNYRLKRWLPPITGMEYASLTTFTTNAGVLGVYFGDEWGRVYELFSGETDGVPSGTTSAPITGATSGTITAGAATFYTSGSGLAGMPAAVRSPAGVWQWVRVQSNTGTVLTLDTTNGPSLSPVPATDGTWLVVVGGIEWYWDTPRITGGNRRIEKRGRLIYIEGSATSTLHQLEVKLRFNRSIAFSESYTLMFPSAGLVWGVGQWGVDTWGVGGTRAMRKRMLKRSFFDAQIRVQNFYPGQPFEITSYAVTADWQSRRSVPSV